MDWNWIEIVQLLAASFERHHEIGLFQQDEVFGHCLTCHIPSNAEFAQGLTIVLKEPV